MLEAFFSRQEQYFKCTSATERSRNGVCFWWKGVNWKCVTETCGITTLTFPVRIVYKQLWTSDGWTGTGTPCLNKTFLLSASHFFSLVCFPDKQKSMNACVTTRANAPNRNKYTCNTYITFCLTLNTCKLLLSTHLHTVKLRGVEYYITFYKWHHFSYILIILQIIPCISIATWGKK